MTFMSKDKFLRNIDYLRVSVTDKCNFRCIYCMPEEGIQLKDHNEILSLEEFLKIIKISAQLGIKKVRITGGEPLVRRNIVDFIGKVKAISGIEDVSLTTNGALLSEMAANLKQVGLDRVNISLDTLNKKKFEHITRLGQLDTVLAGIERALEVGFDPVKLNVVIINGFNFDEINEFVSLTKDKPLHVRFIELMPIGETDKWETNKFVSAEKMLQVIKSKHQVLDSAGIKGAGPARYMSIIGHQGSIGFISALSNHFCHQCNRMRLTSEGKLRPCLHSSQEIDLKSPLRKGYSDDELKQIIIGAIKDKPKQHRMGEDGWTAEQKKMFQIGG